MINSSAGSLGGDPWTFTRSGPCDDTTAGGEVTILIDNPSLSPAVQEAFQISIPFLPPITLDPILSGTFRCE
jgi:hypothetical protein